MVPDYCSVVPPEEEEEDDPADSRGDVVTNVWLGPVGTVRLFYYLLPHSFVLFLFTVHLLSVLYT